MIIKALGILDIAAAALFLVNSLLIKFLPSAILWIMALYLIVKGVIFLLSADIASIIDIICGLIIASSIFFSLPKLLMVIVGLYLVQKGVFSIIS